MKPLKCGDITILLRVDALHYYDLICRVSFMLDWEGDHCQENVPHVIVLNLGHIL